MKFKVGDRLFPKDQVGDLYYLYQNRVVLRAWVDAQGEAHYKLQDPNDLNYVIYVSTRYAEQNYVLLLNGIQMFLRTIR